MDNLEKEGLAARARLVGDTMYDLIKTYAVIASQRSSVLTTLALNPRQYLLATVHRAANTDEPDKLRKIMNALEALGEVVVFPVHPRTRQRLAAERLGLRPSNVGYLDMLMLEQSSRLILTDSGGVQKEAYWLGIPCVTLREETEWLETIKAGWNILAGTDTAKIVNIVQSHAWPQESPSSLLMLDSAAQRILSNLT